MGALSGNRLRPNADCSCYRSRLVDPLSARLPDRTPPRRGKRVGPSRTSRLAQSRAIREFVAVRPAGSDEGASPPPSSPNPPPSPRPLQPTTVRPRPPARRRFVRQPSAQRVRVAPNRRRQPCSAAKRLADRAPIEPPPLSQPARSHVATTSCDSSTGPTWRRRCRGWPGRSGATTRRDSPSTMSGRPNPGSKARRSPLPARPVRRPPCDRGSRLPGRPASPHADLPYLQGSSDGPPAIVAHDAPPTRLEPGLRASA